MPTTINYESPFEILGGRQVFRKSVNSRLDVHELILHGFPGGVLRRVSENITFLHVDDNLEKVVGISIHTFHRRKGKESVPLSVEQSSRIWRFAEIMVKAVSVFGSKDEAEKWFLRSATGLDSKRPIDLIQTTVGAEILDEHLTRVEYGVYT